MSSQKEGSASGNRGNPVSETEEKSSRKLLQEIIDFRDSRQSVLMATVNKEGIPEASTVPYVFDNGNIYIFISALSRHTLNLAETGQASILLVEDENSTSNMFARRRLNYLCRCDRVGRDSQQWKRILDMFEARFGKFVQTLRALPDFNLFRLKPVSGNYVCGFGKAFRLEGDNLRQVNRITLDDITAGI